MIINTPKIQKIEEICLIDEAEEKLEVKSIKNKTIRGICNLGNINFDEDENTKPIYNLNQAPLQKIRDINKKYFDKNRIAEEVKKKWLSLIHI